MVVLRQVPREETIRRAGEVACLIMANRYPGTRWRVLPLPDEPEHEEPRDGTEAPKVA